LKILKEQNQMVVSLGEHPLSTGNIEMRTVGVGVGKVGTEEQTASTVSTAEELGS